MKERKKFHAVIDTNVLVSSLFSGRSKSNPFIVINSVLYGTIIPVFNNEIIQEYRDVLLRDKFHFKPEIVDSLISGFTDFGICTFRTPSEDFAFPDNDDVVFYEVALSVKDSFLVTGNTKHFPRKPFIITPAEMVEILRNEGLLPPF